MADWIKCSERMPPHGWCICYNTDICEVAEHFYDPVKNTFTYTNYEGEQVVDAKYITHWQPLPDPPQE